MIIDEDLNFDKRTKRYYLTEEYIINKLGTDISQLVIDDFDTNLTTLVDRTIKYACDMVYDFLCANAVHKLSALYRPTQYEEPHFALKRALELQTFDFLQNGDSSLKHGGKVSDTVNTRAIQELKSGRLFTTISPNIPENVEEW